MISKTFHQLLSKVRLVPARLQLHDGDTGNICFYGGCAGQSIVNTSDFHSQRTERLKYSLRFFGCDAPELVPKRKLTTIKGKRIETEKDKANRELEIKAGHHVLKNLDAWIKSVNPHSLVWIKFLKNEKFGRLMGHLHIIDDAVTSKNNNDGRPSGNEHDIVQWLIDKKYAKQYFGKKKEEWTSEELNFIINN
jgi:hypothetical protein